MSIPLGLFVGRFIGLVAGVWLREDAEPTAKAAVVLNIRHQHLFSSVKGLDFSIGHLWRPIMIRILPTDDGTWTVYRDALVLMTGLTHLQAARYRTHLDNQDIIDLDIFVIAAKTAESY